MNVSTKKRKDLSLSFFLFLSVLSPCLALFLAQEQISEHEMEILNQYFNFNSLSLSLSLFLSNDIVLLYLYLTRNKEIRRHCKLQRKNKRKLKNKDIFLIVWCIEYRQERHNFKKRMKETYLMKSLLLILQ